MRCAIVATYLSAVSVCLADTVSRPPEMILAGGEQVYTLDHVDGDMAYYVNPISGVMITSQTQRNQPHEDWTHPDHPTHPEHPTSDDQTQPTPEPGAVALVAIGSIILATKAIKSKRRY